MTKRVAIIGAGPSGLSQLRAFQSAREQGVDIPELVCFEKQSSWGGLWNYTWRTGTDQDGELVHSSMYKYLWSNGPKECLEFGDYSFEKHFGKPIPSFPPREVLRSYILGRVEDTEIYSMIRFNHIVRNVLSSGDKKKFILHATNNENKTDSTESFDAVIVASGHFSFPNSPYINGIENFSGRVMHSHDFRNALEVKDKRLLIIGSSYSAEDIALQCLKYGATTVSCCYRTEPMGFKWPNGIEELPNLRNFKDKKAYFGDGNTREVDVVILCTGYLHSFPFIERNLRLLTANRLYPSQLYKGIFWLDNPNFMYLGMQDQYYTFNMFDAQAWYVRDVLLNKIEIPERDVMENDVSTWQKREGNLKDPIEEIYFQTDYCKDLVKLTDYEIDFDFIAKQFVQWESHKEENIVTYRDRSFVSPMTNNKAPQHHTPWWDEMDDSYDNFVENSGN